MDQVEKYIMSRLYKSVFCPETSDDENKDLVTQNRIRWARPGFKSGSHVMIMKFKRYWKWNDAHIFRLDTMTFCFDDSFSVTFSDKGSLCHCVCAHDYTLAIFGSILHACEGTVATEYNKGV